ncbi:immunity 8 family protein [Bradyrhizobium guangdongense]
MAVKLYVAKRAPRTVTKQRTSHYLGQASTVTQDKRSNMFVAQLRRLSSTDADPLETFRPEGPFGIYILAMVGPANGPGQESFGFMVCTPDWFAQNMKGNVVSGRHHLFVNEYNYDELVEFVSEYCSRCRGGSWNEVAQKVARLGYWEFEDYQPSRQ